MSSAILIGLSNQHVLGGSLLASLACPSTSEPAEAFPPGENQLLEETIPGKDVFRGLRLRSTFHIPQPLQLSKPQFLTFQRRIWTRETKKAFEQIKPCKKNIAYFVIFLSFLLIFALLTAL